MKHTCHLPCIMYTYASFIYLSIYYMHINISKTHAHERDESYVIFSIAKTSHIERVHYGHIDGALANFLNRWAYTCHLPCKMYICPCIHKISQRAVDIPIMQI